jgi:hypothetical protein
MRPIVRFGRLDPTKAQNEGINQRFQRLADAVAVVSLREPDVSGERALESNLLKEVLEQRHAAKLGQAHAIDGNAQVSGAAGHCYQTPLLVRFRCKTQNSRFGRCHQALLDLWERS